MSKSELFDYFYRYDRWFWFFRVYHKFMRFLPAFLHRILYAILPNNRKTHPYKLTISECRLGEAILLNRIADNARIFGYYGNLCYIDSIRDVLTRDFICPLSATNQAIQLRIQSTSNATFIHIRRGDYLRLWEYAELGKAYYECAIKEVLKATKKAHFFIFSNDIVWCKQEFLQLLHPIYYVGHASFSFIDNNDESNPTQELMLMRSCQHAITANSTFSWWAAYLIENPNKVVVMPKIHLLDDPNCNKNIMPTEWIVLDNAWGKRMQ